MNLLGKFTLQHTPFSDGAASQSPWSENHFGNGGKSGERPMRKKAPWELFLAQRHLGNERMSMGE